MNTLLLRRFRTINWSTMVLFALGFWLSASLVFDFLIIPGLLSAGMMEDTSFASASYTIFGTFNHLELLCGGIVVASSLIFVQQKHSGVIRPETIGAMILFAIALAYTYILIPQMSALGMAWNEVSSQQVTESMLNIHVCYWFLEATKLIGGAFLLSKFYRSSCKLI